MVTITIDDKITAAHAYAKLGWVMIPLFGVLPDGSCECKRPGCTAHGKHPRIKDWQRTALTGNLERMTEWLTMWPGSNIGIVTGSASGIFAVDIDPKNGGTESWQAELDLNERSMDIDCPQAITASGGRHLIFRAIPGLRNCAGIRPGIDIRGDNGQIVVYPSATAKGQYLWEPSSEPWDLATTEAPDWLKGLLSEKIQLGSVISAEDQTRVMPTGSFVIPDSPAPQGKRKSTVFSIACKARSHGYDHDQILSAISTYNAQWCQPPLENREIEEAARYASRYPTGIPDLPEDAKQFAKVFNLSDPESPYKVPGRVTSPETTISASNSSTVSLAAITNYTMSDLANAERMASAYKTTTKYFYNMKTWLHWDKNHGWFLDESGKDIFFKAVSLIKAMKRVTPPQPVGMSDSDFMKYSANWIKYAAKCEDISKIKASLELFQNYLPILSCDIDCHNQYLKVRNGVVDLRTGKLLSFEQSKELILLKSSPVLYDESAGFPMWRNSLDLSQEGGSDMIEYLRYLSGYSVTGETSEQCMFFVYGDGKNGKSTFMNVLAHVIGDYYVVLQPDSIMKRHGGGGIPNDIARLFGSRFCQANEPNESDWLDEGKIRYITGGDIITARKLHKEFFDFVPTHKVFLVGSQMPNVRGTDLGIWRRLKLIPFTCTIPENRRVMDYDKRIIESESSGVLNWIVSGAIDWYRHGALPTPSKIQMATEGYRSEMDVIGQFIDESLAFSKDFNGIPSKMIYTEYVNFCQSRNDKNPKSYSVFIKILKTRLSAVGCPAIRTADWNGFSGVEIKSKFSLSFNI